MVKTTVSADIGGTFTDLVILQGNRIITKLKVPTTPHNPEMGVMEAIMHSGVKNIDEFVHATTIATNTLLGQYGLNIPKVALVTTKGFRDVIEIGRQNRPSLYDLEFRRPRSIVSRNMRFELDERTDYKGNVIRHPDSTELSDVLKKVIRGRPESVAVSFLHSYINSENERYVLDGFKKFFRYVSASYMVAPEPREYERTSTTVVNAALMPVISTYISKLKQDLSTFGSPAISIMSNSGGLILEDEAMNRPVSVVESGPAAGVIAANILAEKLGERRIISFDMGGTTAKAGTVVDNMVEITSEYEVGGLSHHGRMVRGSGYPVRYPFVDLAEVSAGGGTIIWLDSTGGLNIGPISAGSDPGPVSYAKGGSEPTITDANLVLGILNEKMSGSSFVLRKDLALEALGRLGDPYEIAEKALKLVDLEMSRAIRIVTVERGIDPSDFTIFGFGGAGPQHAARIAEEMKIRHVVIPPDPGVFSALGLLHSDWKYELRKSYPDEIAMEFKALEDSLRSQFGAEEFELYADCRYEGQGSEINVPVLARKRETIESDFRKLHGEAYGFNLDRKVEILTIRVFGILRRNKPQFEVEVRDTVGKSVRTVFMGNRFLEIPVYSRNTLPVGTEIIGPSLVDEAGSTTLIPEGWKARVGSMGELDMMVI
ncbi:MAG: hydantoinase/oxoprolinase family protein [Thermoplasmataceae archaeon]